MTRLLDDLERRSLIIRVADDHDRRRSLIRISGLGAARLTDAVEASRAALCNALAEELSPSEQEILAVAADLMDRLAAGMGAASVSAMASGVPRPPEAGGETHPAGR